jgi:SOS-response transcriptional repressor LexA
MLIPQEHSCLWQECAASMNVRGMDQNAQLAAEIRLWMQEVMLEKGLTPTSWAQLAGVARTTIARAIKEGYPFVTSSRTLAKLAKAAEVDTPDIRHMTESQIVPLYLPVRYRVQAGAWIEVDYAEQEYPYPPRAVTPDPQFAEWPQWLELVVGDSIDKEIQPGSFAHVVDAIEMGYSPQDQDFVVVERRREQGRLRERSIKQVQFTPTGVELWPRSNNPAWNKPLQLAHPEEGVEAEIVGLVIGSYRSMR